MKEVNTMASQHPFDKGLNDWINSVDYAVKKELLENSGELRELFDKINYALTLFLPLAEQLPVDQAKWIHGEDGILSPPSSIQIIMEFLTQAIYMQVSHLWPAANHSARCALEHTFWTIWQIAHPQKSKTRIGGPEQARFEEMKCSIFEIPRFANYKNEFEFPSDACKTKGLLDKIVEIYAHLSYYVHTSNIHIELKGARPHITHDLSTNPRAERDTRVNISETLMLIVIMLAIACREKLGSEEMKDLERITSLDICKTITET